MRLYLRRFGTARVLLRIRGGSTGGSDKPICAYSINKTKYLNYIKSILVPMDTESRELMELSGAAVFNWGGVGKTERGTTLILCSNADQITARGLALRASWIKMSYHQVTRRMPMTSAGSANCDVCRSSAAVVAGC